MGSGHWCAFLLLSLCCVAIIAIVSRALYPASTLPLFRFSVQCAHTLVSVSNGNPAHVYQTDDFVAGKCGPVLK